MTGIFFFIIVKTRVPGENHQPAESH
jgi:hypothetical protein